MELLLLLFVVAAVSASPLQDVRSNIEFLPFDSNLAEPAYRLLDSVQPTYQRVDLDVFLDESRFDGNVVIDIVVNEPLKQIVLHQKVVAIESVDVFNSENNVVPLAASDTFQTDDYFELLKINFDADIAIGNYSLVIKYRGQINENPLDRGFYKGYYYLNNVKRFYATTQFQPFHARKAFPCFDEPQFKSVFVIAITRDSQLSESYSNMAIADVETAAPGRVKETFEPSPISSAYLMAFHVSDFEATNSTSTAAKPFQIIARQGVLSQHTYAAGIGLEITNQLDEYLDYNYYEMAPNMKNDHIALPDFPSGAMENWGMVNYREAYLLYDEANTNLVNKIFIATIMAHELGHKWFGNLVTCFWWSNLWLNESFASYFEYFGAHWADPSLELDDQFVVDYVHSALNYDSSSAATAMNWTEVNNQNSISAHFSVASYAKGASVLRMMEHFVGAETFRDALRRYLKTNEFALGTPQDMYDAFREAVAADPTFAQKYPGVDVAAVFDSWVQNPGSPVLEVDVNMGTGAIAVRQTRFLITGATDDSSLWQIPITWTHSGAFNFDSTAPTEVMRERTLELQMDAGHNYVLMNIGRSGLYRVNYDDHNWEMIAGALRSNVNAIPKLDKAQIVNDILYFIRSRSRISLERAFDVLSFLHDETDYYVWVAALGQLDWIRRRLHPQAKLEFEEYLLENIQTSLTAYGFNEQAADTTSRTLGRAQNLNFACNMGHEECIQDSLAKWTAFKENDTPVSVNLRRHVYCIGIREGDVTDFDFLFAKYNASENTADMVVMLRALGCTKDADLLKSYLDQSMYNDRIRIHDRTNAFAYALVGNDDNVKHVLEYFYDNYQALAVNYGGVARLNTAISGFSTYLTDFDDIVAFQSWVYRNQIMLGDSFSTCTSVITTSMNNLRWGRDINGVFLDALRGRNSASFMSAPLLALAFTALVHFVRY